MRGVGLPVLNDSGHIASVDNMHHRMHVIRHDAPGVELISIAVEMPERIGHELAVVAKKALAVASVEVMVETPRKRRVDTSTIDR